MNKKAFYNGFNDFFEKKAYTPILGAVTGATMAKPGKRMLGAGHGAIQGLATPLGLGVGSYAGSKLMDLLPSSIGQNPYMRLATMLGLGGLGAYGSYKGVNKLFGEESLSDIYGSSEEEEKPEEDQVQYLTPEEAQYYQALQQQYYG